MQPNRKRAFETGQSLVEYGLIIALVGVFCITALTLLGNTTSNSLTSLSTTINGGTAVSGSTDQGQYGPGAPPGGGTVPIGIYDPSPDGGVTPDVPIIGGSDDAGAAQFPDSGPGGIPLPSDGSTIRIPPPSGDTGGGGASSPPPTGGTGTSPITTSPAPSTGSQVIIGGGCACASGVRASL